MSDALQLPKSWLRQAGSDQRQHIVYLAEFESHTLTSECACLPCVDGYGDVIRESIPEARS